MRILFLCAATVAALVLHPPSTRAQTNSMVSESRPKPAYVVIDQLIAQGAVFYTSDQALRLALDVLTQDQPVLATRLLHAPGPPKNQADTKPGCGTHG